MELATAWLVEASVSKPKVWEFYIACKLTPINRQRGMHHYELHRQEKERKGYMVAQFNTWCPKDALVDGPHPQRTIELLVVRPRAVDDDTLGPMCKCLIDILKCITRKVHGHRVVLHYGVVWDDSRKYARMTFDQKTMDEVGMGAVEGVRIKVTEGMV